MFIPKEVFTEKPLCRSGARDDAVCPYGDKCHFIHEHIHEMDRPQQKRVVKWVDSDSRVEFVGVDEALLKSLREEIAAGNMS